MSGKLSTDPLFKGLTRPPLFFGVSYLYCMLNFGVAIIYFINAPDGTHKLIAIGLLGLFHAVGFIACSKEPLFVELFQIKAQKCLHAWRNRWFHGANSYDSFL